ncbi:MAG: OsmC family protein [Frankia sp.]
MAGTAPAPRTHHYAATCSWSGSTGSGYDHYNRDHDGRCPPAAAAVALSGDPAFGGDGARLNPEQLLVLSAASCQLLSFLALAARARLDVRAYTDDAEAVMAEDGKGGGRFAAITLRPRITVATQPGEPVAPAERRVLRLVGLAHEQCYIASSLTCPITVEPRLTMTNAYAFSDGRTAARRLALLAELFDPLSRTFVTRHAAARPQLAVDLGCGPGYSTAMLAAAVKPVRIVGLDTSPSFLELARSGRAADAGVGDGRAGDDPAGDDRPGDGGPDLAFAEHDLRRAPFPALARHPDLAYARLLLTHLPDLPGAVAAWCGQLAAGGQLLIEETEAIDTDSPALRDYLDYAERLLNARATTIYAGPILDRLVAHGNPPGQVVHNATARLPVPVSGAAAMFALNLAVWRSDPLLASDQEALDGLAAELDRLSTGDPGTGTITWTMRQVALNP